MLWNIPKKYKDWLDCKMPINFFFDICDKPEVKWDDNWCKAQLDWLDSKTPGEIEKLKVTIEDVFRYVIGFKKE